MRDQGPKVNLRAGVWLRRAVLLALYLVLLSNGVVLAQIQPGATTLQFGVTDASGYAQAELTLTNAATSRFHGKVTISRDQFWVQRDDCNLSMGIAPGVTCRIYIRFAAPAACTYRATLTIQNLADPNPTGSTNVPLVGLGAAGAPDCSEAALRNGGRWTYVEGPWIGTGGDAGTIVAVADLGADGEMDAIIVLLPYVSAFPPALWLEERVNHVYVYTLTSGGQYIETTSRWFGTSPLLVPNLFTAFVGDLNGDGKDDIAFGANNEDGRPPQHPTTNQSLWYTRNFGFISTATDLYDFRPLTELRQTAYSISGGDLDGDGDTDLWVCGPFLLINDGAANFTYRAFSPVGAPSAAELGNLCPAALADFDADNDLDLAVGRVRAGTIAMFRNDSGAYVYQHEVLAFPGVRDAPNNLFAVNFGFANADVEGILDLRTADLDADGAPDLIASGGGFLLQQPFFSGISALQPLRGIGGFSFQGLGAPLGLTTLGQTIGTQILQLNREGGTDIMWRAQTGSAPAHRMQVRGDGGGGLRYENILALPTGADFSGGLPVDAIHVADMDADGRPDVVVNRNAVGRGYRGVLLNRTSFAQQADPVLFGSGFE